MNDTELIPLGSGCWTGIHAKRIGIRKNAYPFDWLGNGEGIGFVMEMIKDDFKQMSNIQSYSYLESYPDNYLRMNNYENIAFIHNNFLNDREEFETYKRRINRFREVLNSEVSVNFIYYRYAMDLYSPPEAI